MKHVFILNPKAGFRRTEQMTQLIREKFGDSAIVRFTERAGHASEIAKEYDDAVIYAVGGDGTVNEVLCGMAGSDNTLCVLPEGSGNDFVRTLYDHVPKSKRNAKYLLSDPETLKPRTIDYGKVNEKAFVNIASVGFDAEVVRNSERFKNNPILRRISYILAIFYTIFHYRGTDLEGEIDGVPFKQKALLLCIANGVYYGGGVPIAPGADLSDGKFDTYLIDDVTPFTFLCILPLLSFGWHTKVKYVHHFRAERVTLKGENLTLNLDGELSDAKEVTLEMVHHGLNVLAPQGKESV